MAKRKRQYIQGKFTPKNPAKYVGDLKDICYRSSWELQYMRLNLDDNPNVIKWTSEGLNIRYYNPMKLCYARYFPDFLVEAKKNNGKTVKYLIEIKPAYQIVPPKQTKNKKIQTYLTEKIEYSVNQSKWKAAAMWCEKQNVEFRIVTRDEKTHKFKSFAVQEVLLEKTK